MCSKFKTREDRADEDDESAACFSAQPQPVLAFIMMYHRQKGSGIRFSTSAFIMHPGCHSGTKAECSRSCSSSILPHQLQRRSTSTSAKSKGVNWQSSTKQSPFDSWSCRYISLILASRFKAMWRRQRSASATQSGEVSGPSPATALCQRLVVTCSFAFIISFCLNVVRRLRRNWLVWARVGAPHGHPV